MKDLLKNLIGGAVGAVIVLGIFALIGWFVEWTCADIGRFVLVIGIFSYIAYRMLKDELDK